MNHSHFGTNKDKRQRGSILLQVLVAMSVLSFLFYTLANQVLGYRTQVVGSADIFEVEQALHSLMDYVTYGVQQKWCFSSSWGNDSNCDLAHPRSVERLLMTPEVHEFAKAMISTGRYSGSHATPLPIDQIEGTVVLSQLSSLHPLRFIADEIRNPAVHGVRIRIRRAPAALNPVRGREMMIQIGLDLVNSSGGAILNGASSMSLYSDIGVYPREVGSYALLVANDLRLDKSHTLKPPIGDFHIGGSSNGGKSQPGVNFLSPVFVNRDLHLPGGGAFNPVSFNEQVTLGSGVVKQGGRPYQPSSAGHLSNHFWTQSENFRGFHKGVSIDGSQDAGLNYLSGRLTGTLSDDDLMKQCIHRNLARTDLKVTADSFLIAEPLSSNSSGKNFDAGYMLAFSQTTYEDYAQPFVNEFTVQDVSSRIKDYTGKPRWSKSGDNTGDYLNRIDLAGRAKPVVEVTVEVGDLEVEAVMGYDGKLEFEMNMDPLNKKEDVAREIRDKESEKRVKERRVEDLQREIKEIQNRMNQKTSQKEETESEIKAIEEQLARKTDNSNTSSTNNSTTSDSDTTVSTGDVSGSESDKIAEIDSKGSLSEEELREQLRREQDKLQDTGREVRDLEIQLEDKTRELLAAKASVEEVKKELTVRREDLDHIQVLLDNPPVVKLTASPYYYEGEGQPQFVQLSVEVENQQSLQTLDRNFVDLSVHVEGFDVGYFKTYNQRRNSRTRSPDAFREGYLRFKHTGSELVAPSFLSRTRDGLTAPRQGLTTPSKTFNWAKMGQICDGSLEGNLSGVDWSYSFAPAARHSWNFANPVNGTFNLSGTNARVDGSVKTAVFHIRSIVKTCLIKATANFVTGFFTCDQLIIESRTEPLTIIGTIIASTGSIHPDAVKAGIDWMTIYHPSATDALRHSGVLSGVNCNSMNLPIWHPHPSLPELSQMFKCNPISLRERAEPFMWTSVDPDCGVLPGGIHTTCKRYLSRFEIKNFIRQRGARF